MASLRDYQEEVVKLARAENVVMVGNTGIGKTFVSIMLLREQDYSRKRAFVLAPTRQLVCQIQSKITQLTTLKVDAYCGSELQM
jgi:ERCC4-related helicase